MALNGEGIWWGDAADGTTNPKTFTWTVDFAPQPALAKVWTRMFMPYGSGGGQMYIAGIKSIVRESATAIQVVQASNEPAIGDADMSSVTFGLYIYKCQVTIVLNVSFYD
jgi:hypothetical protein